jgi:hypothetical protein
VINPFEAIVGNGIGDGEEIEGAMDCQTCMVTVHRGLYFDKEQLLVWVCPEGHKSRIEGFHID